MSLYSCSTRPSPTFGYSGSQLRKLVRSIATPLRAHPSSIPGRKSFTRPSCHHNSCSRSTSSSSISSSSQLAEAKRLVAVTAVRSCLRPEHRIIGIGSGSTIVPLVDELFRTRQDHMNRWFVPTGYQSDGLLKEAGLKRAPIGEFNSIDICFDGADSISPITPFIVIKGGGGCALQEKFVMRSSKRKVIIVDHTKLSPYVLGAGSWNKGIPIDIVPSALSLVQSQFQTLYPQATSSLRLSPPGSGKLGPIITDNHHFILDFFPPSNLLDSKIKLKEMETNLKLMTGVVEVGLFDEIDEVFIARTDGAVDQWTRDEGDKEMIMLGQ